MFLKFGRHDIGKRCSSGHAHIHSITIDASLIGPVPVTAARGGDDHLRSTLPSRVDLFLGHDLEVRVSIFIPEKL